MFNVERIKEIVTGPIEPNIPNTLWIDTTNPESPVLKVVVNGAYRAMAGSSSDGDDSDKCLCNIVTVELGDGDYIPSETSGRSRSLPIFSEELNSKIWEYLEDGKCILIKRSEETSGVTVTSHILFDMVQKTLSTAPEYELNFDTYMINRTLGLGNYEVCCCAPENYQTLRDYRQRVNPA